MPKCGIQQIELDWRRKSLNRAPALPHYMATLVWASVADLVRSWLGGLVAADVVDFVGMDGSMRAERKLYYEQERGWLFRCKASRVL